MVHARPSLFRSRITVLVLAVCSTAANAFIATRLLSYWRVLKWEADTEWEIPTEGWRMDSVKVVWLALVVYFAAGAAASGVGALGVMNVCPISFASLKLAYPDPLSSALALWFAFTATTRLSIYVHPHARPCCSRLRPSDRASVQPSAKSSLSNQTSFANLTWGKLVSVPKTVSSGSSTLSSPSLGSSPLFSLSECVLIDLSSNHLKLGSRHHTSATIHSYGHQLLQTPPSTAVIRKHRL